MKLGTRQTLSTTSLSYYLTHHSVSLLLYLVFVLVLSSLKEIEREKERAFIVLISRKRKQWVIRSRDSFHTFVFLKPFINILILKLY